MYDLQRDSRVPLELRQKQKSLNEDYQRALRVGDLFGAFQLEKQLRDNLSNINKYRND